MQWIQFRFQIPVGVKRFLGFIEFKLEVKSVLWIFGSMLNFSVMIETRLNCKLIVDCMKSIICSCFVAISYCFSFCKCFCKCSDPPVLCGFMEIHTNFTDPATKFWLYFLQNTEALCWSDAASHLQVAVALISAWSSVCDGCR